jgi:cytosine/adenosine deaminase-related metal-dependent hydrolase
VNVALGSDGAASNNTQDLFEAMKAAVLPQKVFLLDPQALTSEAALEMATRNREGLQRFVDAGLNHPAIVGFGNVRGTMEAMAPNA